MPTYDYECQKCSHSFEAFHGMNDDPVQLCPQCGGEVKRLIGGGMGIIFKGTGFYVTDNKSGGKTAAPAAKKTDGDTGGNGNSSGEAKPETKKTKEAVTASSSDK